jgi:hypothetical protein
MHVKMEVVIYNHPQNPNLQNEGAQSDQGPTLQTVWILRKWN